MENFTSINPKDIQGNLIELIEESWMLITAGTLDAKRAADLSLPQGVSGNHFNTMTANWGGMGALWFKPVANVYVRPQRFTYEFMEKCDHYTLSFFDKKYKKQLGICGSVSGRKADKITKTGFTPIATPLGGVSFAQAELIIECRKLYADFIRPECFFDEQITPKVYPGNDFHKMYIGEITGVFSAV